MNLWKHKKKGGLFYLCTRRCGCLHRVDYFSGLMSEKTVDETDYVKVAYMGGRK